MKIPRWEHFEHEADMGVRGYGDSLEEAFEQAAMAMSAVITELGSIDNLDCVEVECEAPDNEVLLVDWLNEIIYQMATRHMLFVQYQVNIDNHHLTGRLCGEPASQKKHQPAVEIKGATFTELKVARTDAQEWLAQCVVDV